VSDKLAKAHRVIDPEDAIRAAGTDPQTQSVEKTIAFLTNEETLRDAKVRVYLRQSSERYFNDYFIVQSLLNAVLPLVGLGFSGEATQIYRNLVRYDDPAVWYSDRVWGASIISKTAFTTVLGHDGLLIENEETWGAIAVTLLDRFLLESQRKAWPEWVARRNAIANALGGDIQGEGTFSAMYDDPLWSYHFRFDQGQRRGTPHILVASTIEKALREASLKDTGASFSRLSESLIESKWSLAVSLPLLVLCDRLKAEPIESWHIDVAARILSLQSVEQMVSTTGWRRLLRRALPKSAPTSAREVIVQTIRDHAPDPAVRVNELADVGNWGVLTEKEKNEVRDADAKGEILPPVDPRRKLEEVSWGSSIAETDRLSGGWPHVEQRELLDRLHSSARVENTKSTREDLENDLPPKLEALTVLIRQPEATDPTWKWRFVDWAEQALTALKCLALLRAGKDPSKESLSLNEYTSLLSSQAPWWSQVAEWALQGLSAPASESEGRVSPMTMLSWGSSDPIPASLAFLDELLAIGNGEPFDDYREQLGEAISRVWDGWTGYTRAIALLVLRGYHWHRIRHLSDRVDVIWAGETDPNLLLRCLDFVLARSGVADKLRALSVTVSDGTTFSASRGPVRNRWISARRLAPRRLEVG